MRNNIVSNLSARSRSFENYASWSQGSFVLETLLQGEQTLAIRNSQKIPKERRRIAPLGLNIHVDKQAALSNEVTLLRNLLSELNASLNYWQHCPLGDIYWNKCLIEALDEGRLTELMYNLSSGLKKTNHVYRHLAELCILGNGINKLELLQGLGVTKIVYSLPMWQSHHSQLSKILFYACRRSLDLGYEDPCVRIAFDIERTKPADLIAMLRDLSHCGQHELILVPVVIRQGIVRSCWNISKNNESALATMSSIRGWLISQGYHQQGFDCFAYPQTRSHPQRLFFDLMGQVSTRSPEYLGLGPGATSRIGNFFVRNHSDFGEYTQAVGAHQFPRKSIERLSDNSLQIEGRLASFLEHLEIDLAQTARETNRPFEDYLVAVTSTLNNLPQSLSSICDDSRLIVSADARD